MTSPRPGYGQCHLYGHWLQQKTQIALAELGRISNKRACAKLKCHRAAGWEGTGESGFSIPSPLDAVGLVLPVVGVPVEVKMGEGWKEEGRPVTVLAESTFGLELFQRHCDVAQRWELRGKCDFGQCTLVGEEMSGAPSFSLSMPSFDFYRIKTYGRHANVSLQHGAPCESLSPLDILIRYTRFWFHGLSENCPWSIGDAPTHLPLRNNLQGMLPAHVSSC